MDQGRNYILPVETVGHALAQLMYSIVITTNGTEQVGGVKNAIPNLSLYIPYDDTGPNVNLTIPLGPVLDGIKPILEQYGIGMTIFLNSADGSGYTLKVKIYKGLDRTSSQSVNKIVRFSPAFDSLTNIKELHSIAGLKNVVYTFPPVFSKTTPKLGPGFACLAPGDTDLGFNRRVMVIIVDEITEDMVLDDQSGVNTLLDVKAQNALANNTFTKIVDGEVVPQNDFVYGTDYNLGDIIELQGYSNLVQNARITEYIRSQDAAGERAYPTVSVIA